MARITVSIDCDKCIEDFETEVRFDARNGRYMAEALNKAKEAGWHIGFRTLCPDCLKKQEIKCGTCKHRVEKCMCPPICELRSDYPEKEFIVGFNDFCNDYEK